MRGAIWLTIGNMALVGSHSNAGLVGYADWPSALPPVSRKRHSVKSISPLPIWILIVSKKENMSLCFSKSDRHTFW